jgi:Smg protein
MFDVLAFLVEQFRATDVFGNRAVLIRQLEAAGFQNEEITDALDWLDGISTQDDHGYFNDNQAAGIRIYVEYELNHLPVDVRSLLQFLENHGALTPVQRELVINRLLELQGEEINVSSAKLVALIVLWAQQAELPILLGEALLDAVHGEPTMQ